MNTEKKPSRKRKITTVLATVAALAAIGGVGAMMDIPSRLDGPTEYDDSLGFDEFDTVAIFNQEFITGKEEIIARVEKDLRITKDEFYECEWVHHKNSPTRNDVNSVYMYFQRTKDGEVTNPRFRVQLRNDDWIFFYRVWFNIDGVNIAYYPGRNDKRREFSTYVWEWSDKAMTSYEEVLIIKALMDAKKVKIRFEGDTYCADRVMSEKDLQALKDIYQYYIALGGHIE